MDRPLSSYIEEARKGLAPAKVWASLVGRIAHDEGECREVPAPSDFLAVLRDPTAPFWRGLGYYPRVQPESLTAFEAAFRGVLTPKALAPSPVFLGTVTADAVRGLFRFADFPAPHAPVYDPTGHPQVATAWDHHKWPREGQITATDPAVLGVWPVRPPDVAGEASVWRQPSGAILVRRAYYGGHTRWEMVPRRCEGRHRDYWEAGVKPVSHQVWNECAGEFPPEHPTAKLLLRLIGA